MDVRAFGVKDVRAENIILKFLRSEQWGEHFWPGMSTQISSHTSAGYRAQKLSVWAAFPFLNVETKARSESQPMLPDAKDIGGISVVRID